MKKILQIFLVLLLFSCNKIGVSETEAKAVDVVLNYYGGMINRSVGMKTANAKRTDFFELDISKSDLLNKDQKDISHHAANIAYLFYSNLNSEKSNYDEIRVIINLENGEKKEYKFPVAELNEIVRFYPEITKTNDFINYENYTSLRNQFSEKVRPTESELKELFEKFTHKIWKHQTDSKSRIYF